MTQLRAIAQADEEVWKNINTEAALRLPPLIRNRPASPTYAPSLQKQVDILLLEREGARQKAIVAAE